MIKNYFKIAWRNLVKNKEYAAINIGGLAVGMAVTILIGLWIYDELSFEKKFKNYDSIAQVLERSNFSGQKNVIPAISRPLEFELRNKYGSDFKNIVMSYWEGDHMLSLTNKKITQPGRFMQSGAPDMLSLEMIEGSRKGLEEPNSILLSQSAAKAIFGDESPMNKTMKIDDGMDVKVTGVYKDLPYNTEFKNLKFISSWDLLMTNNDWMNKARDRWENNSFLMYVQLQPNASFASVAEKIKKIKQEHAGADLKKFNYEYLLHPMSRWHLYSEWKNGVNAGGRIQFVWMFGIIGVFVLLLACINFMNLSTARSEKRAKEVGIRKTLGSVRYQLIKQFLSESFLIVLIAFALAILFVALSIKWFNDVADKKMLMPVAEPWFWVGSFSFIILTSAIAGSYPALYLSSFNPVKVLKGTFQSGRFAALPRKVLVVIQFTVSVALICGTIIVYRQIQHAKNRSAGYDRKSLLTVESNSPEFKDKFDVISRELKNTGAVVEVAQSLSPLTAVWAKDAGFDWKDKDPNKVGEFAINWITHDYGKTVGWRIKQGRDFSKQFAADSTGPNHDPKLIYNVIINEAGAKYMGLKDPVGEIIKWRKQPLKIIGVAEDVVTESPYEPVAQMVYIVNYVAAGTRILMRLNPTISASEALPGIESVFKKMAPAAPFDYKFADTEYSLKFAAEERIGKLSSLFAGFAIFISCLGLFGLASFIAEKRIKEIGIRKVLGASVYNLWKMLSKDFVALVVISCLIAVPVAYYFLHQWLQKYEYRTTINWWVFAIAIGSALIITLLTVSFQAIRAAISNPVKNLRAE